jgi:hypothetical protein
LKNKCERLVHTLIEHDPSIIIITEHGLKEDELTNIHIAGYSLIGGFSRQLHRKGGVLIYSKENLVNNIEYVSTPQIELNCETSLMKIRFDKHGRKILYILGIYRSPKGNLNSALDLLNEIIDSIPTNDYIVVMGDMNIDCLKTNHDSDKLKNTLISCNLYRIPLPPTRISFHKHRNSQTITCTKSSIDCICTNILEENIKTEVIVTGLSDHLAQKCIIRTFTEQPQDLYVMKRVFNNLNLGKLKSLLSYQFWDDVYSTECPDKAYEAFLNIFYILLNSSCPMKNLRFKPKLKERSTYIDEECKILKEAYLKLLRTKVTSYNENILKSEIADKKKEYDLKIKEKRRQCNINLINTSDNKSKMIWSIVNNGSKKHKLPNTITSIINDKNVVVTDPKEIAYQFNKYFVNVTENMLQNANRNNNHIYTFKSVKELKSTKIIEECILSPTNMTEVKNIILSLKSKTSAGFDEMSSIMLKYCVDEIAPLLVDITNKSFKQGVFPSKLKIAKVLPIYKEGNILETGNYRPISIIPTISKVIEKIVLTRLISHISKHNLFNNNQHGFMKDKSTTSALIDLLEYIIDQLENGHIVTGILLDFSKAFDSLGHELLLRKLETLNVKNEALKWFTSYLKGRFQFTELSFMSQNNLSKIKSNEMIVRRGVPQGSVLGPVLFILFINDLPNYLQEYCQTLLYADDTILLLNQRNLETLNINSYIALNMAQQYCQDNDLILNENKTKQIFFSNRNTTDGGLPNIFVYEETNYLGIILDEKLSWSVHIKSLCKKLSSAVYMIKRIKQITDLKTTKTVYFAIVNSLLLYGISVWGNTSDTNIRKILVIQKRAIRALAGLRPRESCRQAFINLNIPTVVALYIKEVILFIFKQNKPNLKHVHNHSTRNGTDYSLPAHRLHLFENKPSYIGRKFYNNLPEELKHFDTINTFKNKLNNWLVSNPFYSTTEFLNWKNNQEK